ncbi:MAG TPA: hypothetical protein VJS67_15550 [Pseudonocardiaceae bacterium]|nr:hypothetical protein [Pseudonocardiaceae bacterium]
MTMPRERRTGDLADVLQRAVAAQILSAEQAQAVLAAERSRVGGGRRLPLIEAVGYLGGLLALSGAVTLVIQYWREVPTAGRLGLLAAVAAATWLVGARISEASAGALIRLRGALWFASTAAVAAFAGQAASDLAHAGDAPVWLWAGVAAAVHGGLLWGLPGRLRDRPAQHLACLAGVLMAAGGAAGLAGGESAVGLAIAGAGAVWVAAGWRALLPPPVIAMAAGGVAVLAGAGITAGDWSDAAPLLGLAASGVLLAVGVATDRTPLTIVGLAGGFGYLPWTVGHFFADSLGAPLAILLCGIALLAITFVVLRRPSRSTGTGGA